MFLFLKKAQRNFVVQFETTLKFKIVLNFTHLIFILKIILSNGIDITLRLILSNCQLCYH